MKRAFGCCAVALAILSSAVATGAEEDQLRAAGFEPLVAGDSLDAWDVQPWHSGHWVARDGTIVYDGRAEHRQFQKNSLWTKRKYGDVELVAQWRLPRTPRLEQYPIVLFNGDFLLDKKGNRVLRARLGAGDSGILFRGVLRCQANTWSQELGSGEVNGYRTDPAVPPAVRRACIPLVRADRPLGEWNEFRITLRGDHMTTVLNGEPVVDVALPNLPAAGPIGLQHHGDPVEFRGLGIRELGAGD